jgi:Na+/H+ antiporter NhaD/arsenite permease-like protein
MPRRGATRFVVLAACAALLAAGGAAAAGAAPADNPELFGIPVDFYFFALTLIGVALFHHYTLQVALTGLAVISTYKILFAPFKTGAGLAGFASHMAHEWVILTNLLLLLLGFALLARHFEKTHIPALLPRFLPHDWKGAFLMLVMVFVLSSFLDNIAAAMIGGAMAHTLFRAKVHIGYLAAIVAASNAGGSGSVIGDTTTTMMWIDKVNPLDVLDAYVAAVAALFVFGIPAALQQQRYSPILKHAHQHTHIDWMRAGIVFGILAAAIAVNVTVNNVYTAYADYFPYLGAAVWVVIIWSVPIRRPDWELLPEALRGSIFLIALVTCASMMPVEKLPPASWVSTFGLGFLSSVFDNIPLTALALKQDGYDWGLLAYAVGFGGSMIWFGSSAGVALSNLYPEARSVGRWLVGGWHVTVAYVVGFVVFMAVIGWHPHPKQKVPPTSSPPPVSAPAAAPAR